MAQLEEEKREHDNKMKKMETEMEQVFEMKVREKRQKLKDSEADVSKAHLFLAHVTFRSFIKPFIIVAIISIYLFRKYILNVT